MVLTIIERENGTPSDPSLESTTLARTVAEGEGESLDAIVFDADGDDSDAGDVADELSAYGVDTIYVIEHADMEDYAPYAWAESVNQVLDEAGASVVVAPGTDRGNEVLAHLSVSRDVPMASSVVDVTVDGSGEYELTRQRWGGSLLEHARLSADTKLITVVPHEVSAESADATGDGTVETVSPSLDETDLIVTVERREESDVEGVPLDQARIVVSGGRGVGSADGFEPLEELAELLDGAVGSSRAAVNEGWRPHNDQVGQTGTKIAPDLYIPCGISGAVQHWVGCKGSENVVAINTDPEAAIIQKADYAVIADLHEVVPAISEEIRSRTGE